MTFSCMHVHSKADFGHQLDSQCHDFLFEGHNCWEVELHIVLKISLFLGNCFLVLCLKSCDFSAGYKYMQYFVKKKIVHWRSFGVLRPLKSIHFCMCTDWTGWDGHWSSVFYEHLGC